MKVYAQIKKGKYIDSLETLFSSSVLNEQPGVDVGYVGMATASFKDILAEIGLMTEEIDGCGDNDYVIVARAESEEAFRQAAAAVTEDAAAQQGGAEQSNGESFSSVRTAVQAHPEANMCSIAVPGEYALSEVKKALNMGLHCVVFSNNVPLEDEREMKELAREKGLLCMGPDCGVANINGAALVLASINARGPFGICGASGTGIQHVAAILHAAGTGVSQTIGTGGNDLKNPVGGIMMLMGIDALEADMDTKYIALISRRPGDEVLPKVLNRISECRKPVVVFFMGCERELIESAGAVWAENLDDCAQKCLNLISKEYPLESDEELSDRAAEAVKMLGKEQKYVRGAFSGGTYMDEAMQTLAEKVGPIYSNSPLKEDWRLLDSHVSVENTCIDYGEEEFTLGRPHPAIDPGVRQPAILREAADPETAVILLDFILTPPGHMDPAGYALADIRVAQEQAQARGRHLIFVASVLGTNADLQNLDEQCQKLRESGVLLCRTNERASALAGEIIRQKKEMDEHGM
ncbi:FdrA family protein [Subdoligranulum sp. AM23-21AC]|uniref:FdrA family protein n=1 Tax=Ruthenibacterium lactatiformans TaxID=1550024 RepID=UPI000E3F826F|nr:FdrA family protein [Ruthenibacterium lactatiformans]RGD20843.1 FdrA family protein [Subdoligranulum sp. AM23-21AC]RJW30452.1 FdrA family protein [Subdoligranulum sp. TF05-17AC]